MIFLPYADELEIINRIQSIYNEEYILIRLTSTMINKNNLDTNNFFRLLLLKNKIVDYDKLLNGGLNKISIEAIFIQEKEVENIKLNFYKVFNKRSDKRFSIEKIKSKERENKLNIGDLLYISVLKKENEKNKIFIINLTHNVPKEDIILKVLGFDKIMNLFITIRPKLKEIIKGGYYDNYKGKGKIADKDVGETLEYLLGINTNNRKNADYKGLIEIKSKISKTKDTLFSLRPKFEGTIIEKYEPNDRYRVSAFTRYFGYNSDKHVNYNNLYITIGTIDAPQNKYGFYLNVNENLERVEICKLNNDNSKNFEVVGYWSFNELEKQLLNKHPATIWIKAENKIENNMVKFKYKEIEFSREPKFSTFISFIKNGYITYDWRGYTTKTGKYEGKNHGNAWRIKSNKRNLLFGFIEKIEF